MRSNVVADFLPSRNGLHFANRFGPAPLLELELGSRRVAIGDAAFGVCGGMSLTVLDLFTAGVLPPTGDRPPAAGTPRFEYLVRRQLASLDRGLVPLRFYELSGLRSDRSTSIARIVGRRSRTGVLAHRDWPAIRRDIDRGRPSVLGIVRVASLDPRQLVLNHQVLAYGYEVVDDRLSLRVYDPNHPDRDDVELRLRLGPERRAPATVIQTTDEPVVTFFRAPYTPVTPRPWMALPG
jgi:hypothetical protein